MAEEYDVLIPAHGESLDQLNNLLISIAFQKTPGWRLKDIFLCSDNPEISFAFRDRSLVYFIYQEPKKGKPDALNKMLSSSTASRCIENSADCIPASELTYHYLLNPLNDPRIGAVTSNPIPFNSGFMYLPNIVWSCHNFVQPKLSAELFSFKRALIDPLPEGLIHDDAYIHNMILRKAQKVLYEPRAFVFNRAPETLREFYLQRKKNVIGNIQLAKEFHENPPTQLRLRSLILMALELLANTHGKLDYARKHVPKGLIGYNLKSTKDVIER